AATTRPLTICAAWLAVAIGLTLVAPNWRNQAQDDDIRFLPAASPSVRGLGTLERAFPQDVFASRAVVTVERPDGPLTAADFAFVDRAVAALERLRAAEPELQLTGVVSYRDGLVGGRLVSADR